MTLQNKVIGNSNDILNQKSQMPNYFYNIQLKKIILQQLTVFVGMYNVYREKTLQKKYLS